VHRHEKQNKKQPQTTTKTSMNNNHHHIFTIWRLGQGGAMAFTKHIMKTIMDARHNCSTNSLASGCGRHSGLLQQYFKGISASRY
jgi:hypothetical protein